MAVAQAKSCGGGRGKIVWRRRRQNHVAEAEEKIMWQRRRLGLGLVCGLVIALHNAHMCPMETRLYCHVGDMALFLSVWLTDQ